MAYTRPTARNLDEIIKTSLFSYEHEVQIQKIWKEHHAAKKTCAGTTLTTSNYRLIRERTVQCPFFIFPVRREKGHFLLLSQFQGNAFFFTYLEEYRRNPATATPYMVVSLYPELHEKYNKDIVLARAELISPQLQKADAERLMDLVLRFYTLDTGFKLVKDFNLRPNQFNYHHYIQTCP